MAITLIRNSTGAELVLFDVGRQLADLTNGGPGSSVQQVPTTITSVSRGGVSYHNRQGAFMNGDSYLAEFVAAAPPQPAAVRFTGHTGTVTFT